MPGEKLPMSCRAELYAAVLLGKNMGERRTLTRRCYDVRLLLHMLVPNIGVLLYSGT